MTLEEIDQAIAEQQRRLCKPGLGFTDEVARLREDVEKQMRNLLAKKRRLLRGKSP